VSSENRKHLGAHNIKGKELAVTYLNKSYASAFFEMTTEIFLQISCFKYLSKHGFFLIPMP
jgi:hypothetical protein